MISSSIDVRPAEQTDLPELLEMMRELAAFEGYLEEFAVTEADLLQRGFPSDGGPPEFFSWVAVEKSGARVGYTVHYLIPFTYDLKPTLVIKELFVRTAFRRAGVGRRLLEKIEQDACARGCRLIHWAVLPGNEQAEKFYQRWGGAPDTRWSYWRRQIATPGNS